VAEGCGKSVCHFDELDDDSMDGLSRERLKSRQNVKIHFLTDNVSLTGTCPSILLGVQTKGATVGEEQSVPEN
jgi:hypothetical protein